MRRPLSPQTLCTALLAALLLALAPAPQVQAGQPPAAQQKNALTPQQAAAKAKAAHGGKVLKVTRQGKGYRVKLLLDSGRVKTVDVR